VTFRLDERVRWIEPGNPMEMGRVYIVIGFSPSPVAGQPPWPVVKVPEHDTPVPMCPDWLVPTRRAASQNVEQLPLFGGKSHAGIEPAG
jgi:hypothetical protein